MVAYIETKVDDGDEDDEEASNPFQSNVRKVQAIRGLRMALFGIPVVVEYLQRKGMGVEDVFHVKAVHSLAVVLLELPAGYVSDRFGRKPAIVASCACGVLYWTAMGAGNTKRHFQAAQVLLGMSDSLFSGTDAAVLYESLEKCGRKGRALHGESQAVFIAQATETMASILGGYVASHVSLRSAMWLTCLPYALALGIGSTLVETSGFRDHSHQQYNMWDSMVQSAFSLVQIVKKDLINLELGPEVLAGVLLGTTTYTAVWLFQPLWKRAGLSLGMYGWAWASLNLSVALTALTAPTLQQKLGTRPALIFLGLWGGICYFLLGTLGNQVALVLAGCALYWVRGGGGPIVTNAINRQATPTHRASLLSVRSMLTQAVFLLWTPAVGYVSSTTGLTWACVLTGVVLSVGASCLLASFTLLYPQATKNDHEKINDREGRGVIEVN